jgi:methylmalonyl-CoA mutase N-terminal domain/subunit
VSISGYHIREAGASAVQELAFTLADGLVYVETGVARGLDVDCFAPRLSFFFNAHNDFFEEIAKYRAARRIWAREMQRRFQPKDQRSLRLRFHTQTSGSALTAQQPENNIVRVTLQALAAVLGGTQSLHTNSFDEALAIPTEKAATIALRTQQIIAHESGVASTIDPLAGSYFVETLTNQMEQAAYDYFAQIESLGGVLACVENGFFLREVADASARYQREVDAKERIIVGVNDYLTKEQGQPRELHRTSAEAVAAQLRRLAEVKATRDNVAVGEKLEALRAACRSEDNVLPPVLECVKAYATLGEIVGVMRDVFGDYREPSVF